MANRRQALNQVSYQAALSFPVEELAALLNRGFEDYFVNINFTRATLLSTLTRDSVDLKLSQVALVDDTPIAIGLIARRGWTARLAAMGIVSEARAKGYGTALIDYLNEMLAAEGFREFVLEVIEANTPAIRLYEKAGFQTLRRLVGLNLDLTTQTAPTPNEPTALSPVDVVAVAAQLTADSLPHLPWQLSGTSLMVSGPPSLAYQVGQSYAVLSDPSQPTLSIRSLFVDPDQRQQGRATQLVSMLLAAHPNRKWSIPALCPESLSPIFLQNGFKLGELSQRQMKRTL